MIPFQNFEHAWASLARFHFGPAETLEKQGSTRRPCGADPEEVSCQLLVCALNFERGRTTAMQFSQSSNQKLAKLSRFRFYLHRSL